MNPSEEPFFRFRVLIEREQVSGTEVSVARCLETGHVCRELTPAGAQQTVLGLIKYRIVEVLKDGDFRGLLERPSPVEVWVRWMNLSLKTPVHTVGFEVPASGIGLKEVWCEVAVVVAGRSS
jgi:hypothetical protein